MDGDFGLFLVLFNRGYESRSSVFKLLCPAPDVSHHALLEFALVCWWRKSKPQLNVWCVSSMLDSADQVVRQLPFELLGTSRRLGLLFISESVDY